METVEGDDAKCEATAPRCGLPRASLVGERAVSGAHQLLSQRRSSTCRGGTGHHGGPRRSPAIFRALAHRGATAAWSPWSRAGRTARH